MLALVRRIHSCIPENFGAGCAEAHGNNAALGVHMPLEGPKLPEQMAMVWRRPMFVTVNILWGSYRKGWPTSRYGEFGLQLLLGP